LSQAEEGQFVEVAEDWTEYTYEHSDQLKEVSMARGGTTQLRTFVYDGEQRLQSVTQPETGTVTYTYDALGRTSTKTDAKNQKIQYLYDSHSRVSEVRRYPVSTGAEDVTQRTTFYWDYSGARNGAGRVGLIQYGNGFYELFNYKVSGLVEEKGLWAPGSAAWLSAWYSYNDEGQRTSLKYPDVYDVQGQIVSTGRTINSIYDSMGRLATIRDPGLGGGTDMVSSAQYNAAGQLTQMTVAWEGTRTFNYNTLGQLTRQTSPGVDLEYIFPSTDNDGRLWKKKDWLSGEEVTYQYDEIGRLTAAATTGPAWGLSWTYDGFGNRSAQTVTKGSAPAMSVSVNPATNRVVGLGYDNNGNQTNWSTPLGPVTAAYDVDNRLASISTPNGSEVYAYSAANQRLRKQGKLYFYGVSGELLVNYDFAYGGGGTTPLNPKTQVYFGGTLVFGEGDRRITTDRLGSTVRTEGYFQPEYRYRYYPYGEQQGGSSNEDQVKFGTYWRDSVSGLDYARNRYFAAGQGRFTSADPYVMSGGMGNPQGWNRYAYVGADPVNLHDPSGLNARGPYPPGYCPADRTYAECFGYSDWLVFFPEPGGGTSFARGPEGTGPWTTEEQRKNNVLLLQLLAANALSTSPPQLCSLS
jgi:RHS repeat-associated protein